MPDINSSSQNFEVLLVFCNGCGTLVGQAPINYGPKICCKNCGNKFTDRLDGFISGSFFNSAAKELLEFKQ